MIWIILLFLLVLDIKLEWEGKKYICNFRMHSIIDCIVTSNVSWISLTWDNKKKEENE